VDSVLTVSTNVLTLDSGHILGNKSDAVPVLLQIWQFVTVQQKQFCLLTVVCKRFNVLLYSGRQL